ncbi:dTMP kinase [Candidatus Pacearchaeota archaeon]|nr:dTMP kinase [Candidatus Pacearchaeota archaeon]|tara:strand:- start:11 stop:700 length:690 start_codon:yes stop_codon:yes gene_type:complete
MGEEDFQRGHEYRGLFLSFEGPEAGGKTSQKNRTVAWLRNDLGYEVNEVRHPGGTEIGEKVRKILLDPENWEMDDVTELLLFGSCLSQLVAQEVRPALRRGEIVVADRFIDSFAVYQGVAGGISNEKVLQVAGLGLQGVYPDLTHVFDVSPEIAAVRLGDDLDRMEQKGPEFHAKVRQGYLDIVNDRPRRVKMINTDSLGEDGVWGKVRGNISDYLDAYDLRDNLRKVR